MFNDIKTPMNYMKNLFIDKCDQCTMAGSGGQLLTVFSMFVSTQFFPYHFSYVSRTGKQARLPDCHTAWLCMFALSHFTAMFISYIAWLKDLPRSGF